jgi:putative endonuclease
MAFTYMLECADGTYYVGSTIDLDRRLLQHSAGEGATYIRTRRPVRLVWSHEQPSIRDAYFLEKQIQNWSRAKRLALIEGRFGDLPELARSRTPPVSS